jgi:hypothetical protein
MDLLAVIGNENGDVEKIQSLIQWELGGKLEREQQKDFQESVCDLILRNTDEVISPTSHFPTFLFSRAPIILSTSLP